ncbi:hypothetical protein PR003_g18711 [Phytophthora rubi]|uniref:Uncharacterized protein n=1 Tax=Phytophthora rubi TaxID=129364 RepID=A0A6A4E3J1_9STRA|nr:hypothetical protein PR002_g23956 [Phytophthora rubi]KAE9316462.1 hypothetical protein PR003_g18711 [Phytophthora rubi]
MAAFSHYISICRSCFSVSRSVALLVSLEEASQPANGEPDIERGPAYIFTNLLGFPGDSLAIKTQPPRFYTTHPFL